MASQQQPMQQWWTGSVFGQRTVFVLESIVTELWLL